MSAQLTLDEAPDYRYDDPDTSKSAGSADRITQRNADCMTVLRVLIGLGRANAYEVWQQLDGPERRWKEGVVSKRLSSLRNNGYVRDTGERRCGSSKQPQRVLCATEFGLSCGTETG